MRESLSSCQRALVLLLLAVLLTAQAAPAHPFKAEADAQSSIDGAKRNQHSSQYEHLLEQRGRLLAANRDAEDRVGNAFEPYSIASQVFTGELGIEPVPRGSQGRKLLQLGSSLEASTTQTQSVTGLSPPPAEPVDDLAEADSSPPSSILGLVETGNLPASSTQSPPSPSGSGAQLYQTSPGRRRLRDAVLPNFLRAWRILNDAKAS